MATSSFVIASRRVVTPGGVGPGVVVVVDGVVESVEGFEGAPPRGVEDLGELVISPGVVDTHVHVNDPGRAEWEGWECAGRAAAAGGVTCLIDMPLNSIPATTSAAGLEAKVMAAAGRCQVDYGFWGGVVPGNTRQIAELWAGGVLGFKCFVSPSGVEEFPCVGEVELGAAAPELARLGAVLLAHAEEPSLLREAELAQRPREYASYLRSRPWEAEHRAVEMMAQLSAETGVRVHIVHVSASEALAVIADAKRHGLKISAETCPHYLTFNAEDVEEGATRYKCAPPIRSRENRERLWAGLRDGALDLIASDHSPCPPDMKRVESGSFAEAWGGISSLQLGLSAVWSEARLRGFGLHDVARWMSRAPAKLAGLEGRKGALAPGYDADFVIWDPEAEFVVEHSMLQHRHSLTPYLGRRLRGVVRRTVVRGVNVFEAGRFAEPATGRRVERSVYE